MHALMLHRSCNLGPARSVTAAIEAVGGGFAARFRIEGNIAALAFDPPEPVGEGQELWRSTCFEVFWQPIGAPGYTEFNFAPSRRWAAYGFDRYREGMRDLCPDAIAIETQAGEGALTLEAKVAADLETPAQVGLSTVIEHGDGTLQYWALAFGPGKPDFHSEACRQLIVDR